MRIDMRKRVAHETIRNREMLPIKADTPNESEAMGQPVRPGVAASPIPGLCLRHPQRDAVVRVNGARIRRDLRRAHRLRRGARSAPLMLCSLSRVE